MKKQFLTILIAVLITTSLFGQKNKSNIADSTIILKLENDWAIALVQRDETVFNKLLADDFFYTENEKMYTRSEVLQSAMSVSDTIVSAYNKDMEVHIKEKTAIVTGWLYVNGRESGSNFIRKYRFTDVWFNTKGVWQLIAAHDYLLP